MYYLSECSVVKLLNLSGYLSYMTHLQPDAVLYDNKLMLAKHKTRGRGNYTLHCKVLLMMDR